MYGRYLLRVLRNVILTGLAVVLPLAVTLYLIWFTINLIAETLGPAVALLEAFGVIGFFRRRELIVLLLETGLYGDVIGVLSEIIAVVLFVVVIVVVGVVTRYRRGELLVDTFDYLIASIPGIGTVYQTLRRVGNIVLNETATEFEAVKLLELLGEETYVIAFQTNPSPESVAEATGREEMMTLFVPMAPNPVTGGFLVYVPAERVLDIDLSIEQAVQAILTNGIAAEDIDAPESASIRSAVDGSAIEALTGSNAGSPVAVEANDLDDPDASEREEDR